MTTIVYQRSFFADLNGLPLDGGSVYIGSANQDPETNPINTYWDDALTVPATQPLSVTAGYIVNNGVRAAVYVNQSSYSLRARNRSGIQVDYVASATDFPAVLSGSAGSSLVGFLQSGTGAVARTVQDKLRENAVSIADFRAPSDTDWTLAANRAAATGKNVYLPELAGGYVVSNQISQHANGQQFFGDGVTKSYFRIQSGFNMSATGVMYIPSTASEKGAGCTNIGFYFEQPGGATVRANLIQYPWAISAQGVSRLKFGGSVRLSGAWNGFDVRGNTGGFDANLLEIGAFNQGIWVDGAADFFHVTSLNFWPYDYIGGSFLTIWQDGSTNGLKCGRCDSLDIKSITGFNVAHSFFKSGSDEPFGFIGLLSLDGRRSILAASGGRVVVGSVYGTSDVDETKIALTGTANWSFGGHWFLPNTTGTNPCVLVNSASAIGSFSEGWTSSGSPNAPIFRCSSGEMILDLPKFDFGSNTARTQPFIDIAGGRATVSKPRFKDIGTGSGNAIAIASDENHDIEVNASLGWGVSLPSSVGIGSYSVDKNYGATATVAFATPGNSSFTYTTQATTYRVQGGICQFRTTLLFNTNAYTTPSGAFIIQPNIPFLPTYAMGVHISSMANVTFDASKTYAAELQTDGTILVRLITSAGALANFGTTNVPASTSNIQFYISGSFFV